jgi:Transcriptional regulator
MDMSSDAAEAVKATQGAQSLRRAVAVLRALAAAQDRGASLADIAAQCGLTRPTAHRMLQVLVEEGLAERSPRGTRYLIGRDATLLGMARASPFPIRAVAEPFLRRVCEATGDSTVLTLRSGPDSICVDRRTGSYPIQVMAVAVGARLPLGVGVGGLTILAFLPDAEIAQLLQRNEGRLARYRLTAAALLERVREVRERRYAFTETGVIPGTHVLAVPVFGQDERPVAALSINAMAQRLPRRRAQQLVPLLMEQAAGIAREHAQLAGSKG